MPSTADIEIRPADQADAVAIAACLAEAFAPYRNLYTPQAFADTVASAEAVHLRLRQMHVLVATAAGTVVGTVSAVSNGAQGYLRGMAVLPEWRGTGAAAMLLSAIEDWLRARGCREVILDTTEPLKAAIRFYERNGYCRLRQGRDFFGMPLIEYSKGL